MKSDTKEQGNSFDNYLYYKWQIAICYHPMYMIQDEDQGVPALPERTPPWGCDSAEEYLERIKRNLASLEETPGLTLNYEWSIHALADIAERFPDVHEMMRSAAERGQLCFLGGEYSLGSQLMTQLIGVVVAFIWVFTASFIMFKVLAATIGLRVSAEEEMQGLDLIEHGANCYPDFGPAVGSGGVSLGAAPSPAPKLATNKVSEAEA